MSHVIRGFTPADDLNFTIVENPTVTGPTDTLSVAGDINTRRITGTLVDNNFRLGVQSVLDHEVVNLTPSVIGLDTDLNVSLLSQGQAELLITDSLGQQQAPISGTPTTCNAIVARSAPGTVDAIRFVAKHDVGSNILVDGSVHVKFW